MKDKIFVVKKRANLYSNYAIRIHEVQGLNFVNRICIG